MSETTMLDMGGLAFLEGDPLGLRELEDSLAWNPNGPLPDWLDDAGFQDDEATFHVPSSKRPPTPLPSNPDVRNAELAFAAGDVVGPIEPLPPEPPAPPPPVQVVVHSPHEAGPDAPSLIESLAVVAPVEPLVAELVEIDPVVPVPENPTEEEPPPHVTHSLLSIDDILRFVEEPLPAVPDATPAAEPVAPLAAYLVVEEPEPPPPLPARRALGFEELLEARNCLLASIAGRLWAIPLDRIERVTSQANVADAVDLHGLQEGKPRRAAGVAVVFDTGRPLVVDEILGPRSFAWQPSSDDAAVWSLAHSQNVDLLDWESLV